MSVLVVVAGCVDVQCVTYGYTHGDRDLRCVCDIRLYHGNRDLQCVCNI